MTPEDAETSAMLTLLDRVNRRGSQVESIRGLAAHLKGLLQPGDSYSIGVHNGVALALHILEGESGVPKLVSRP